MGYSFQWQKESILVKYTGQIKTTDFEHCNMEICGNSNFKFLKYQISDFLDVESVIVNNSDVNRVVILDKASMYWNSNLKIACVTSDEEIIKLINIYIDGIKDTGWKCQVFNSYESAYNWCNE